MALVLLASDLHVDRFKAGPVTVVWFAAFSLGLVTFALVLVVEWRLARARPAPAVAK
jgi:hypothetical protein